MKIKLFYDKECPFCNSYANYIKVKENYDLNLLNAREYSEELKQLKNKDFNINDGFIIIVDDYRVYQGADAIVFLNQISSKKVYFPNNKFFKGFVYSFIKFIRKIVLKVLGKESNL